jgi:hypothetical protein
MSDDRAKQMAQKFIEGQKKILEQYGDKVIQSKCKDAVSSVTKVFKAINSKDTAQAKS